MYYNELYSFKEEETSTAPFSESPVSNPNMSSDSKEEKTTYPREVIAKEFLDSLRGKMKLMGIDLVGGGLSKYRVLRSRGRAAYCQLAN
jgi:hypothetical protein